MYLFDRGSVWVVHTVLLVHPTILYVGMVRYVSYQWLIDISVRIGKANHAWKNVRILTHGLKKKVYRCSYIPIYAKMF